MIDDYSIKQIMPNVNGTRAVYKTGKEYYSSIITGWALVIFKNGETDVYPMIIGDGIVWVERAGDSSNFVDYWEPKKESWEEFLRHYLNKEE